METLETVKIKIVHYFKQNSIGDAVYQSIKLKESFLIFPTLPSKPYLVSSHTLEEVKEYSKLLEEFDRKKKTFDKEKNEYKQSQSEIHNLIEEMIKEHSGFNLIVPEMYRKKVWLLAWEDGHSGGYSEVANQLSRLIEIFEV